MFRNRCIIKKHAQLRKFAALLPSQGGGGAEMSNSLLGRKFKKSCDEECFMIKQI